MNAGNIEVCSYIGNGVDGDWYSENGMLANRVSRVWRRRKGGKKLSCLREL
jgi:hypothetical protein